MPYYVDHFSGRIRIMDLTVICHGSEFSKSLDNPPHDVLRNIGTVLTQHGQLRLHARIVYHVTGEQVSKSRKEIIS